MAYERVGNKATDLKWSDETLFSLYVVARHDNLIVRKQRSVGSLCVQFHCIIATCVSVTVKQENSELVSMGTLGDI